MAEPPAPLPGGLRALTREAVRARIADTALVLFDEHGFETTTVDDVAAAVGISPRSFFRYFPSKEDAVIGDLIIAGEALRDNVAQRIPNARAWDALHGGIRDVMSPLDADPVRWLRIVRVINSAASLRARNLEKHLSWSALLVPLVAAHLATDEDTANLTASALVGMAFACLDAALAGWAATDGLTPIVDVIDAAFAAIDH